MNGLVLSLFPGIDMFGRAFEQAGFCVVRGPDPIYGGDIRDFAAPRGVFDGVIGGTPCQDFSAARRTPPSGQGVALLQEFVRVIAAVSPTWFVTENVPGVPDVAIGGYEVQRFNLDARDCGMRQRRLRCFQFGSRDGTCLVIPRCVRDAAESQPCCLATEGTRAQRRSWADFCEAQGLPGDFELPGWSIAAKYRAVGNGVPLPMGRVVAIAVTTRVVTGSVRLCVCNCGRRVAGNALHATAACRKRMERRRRHSAGVSGPHRVTASPTQ